MGDIVKLNKDQDIPADMILVDASGDVFISTGSLDGEKTLKPKAVLESIRNEFKDGATGHGLKFRAIPPSMEINKFEGSVEKN